MRITFLGASHGVPEAHRKCSCAMITLGAGQDAVRYFVDMGVMAIDWMRTAGIPGALAANLGVLMPAVTLCALAAKFYESFRKNHRMQQVMIGVRPASVGMILGLTVSLCLENYGGAAGVSLPAAALGALDLFLLLKCKVSIPAVIGISAAGGLLLFGVLGL